MVVTSTRALYKSNNHMMRLRYLNKLKESKKTIRQQLSHLGIRTLRPEDIAWNYVVTYNEKIRELWVGCNQMDPYEKDRVMREIDDLNHKRQQGLAEFNQDDCPIKFWELKAGWVQPEYRQPLPPLEPEPVQQQEPAQQQEKFQQLETLEEPELVATQASFTDFAPFGFVNDNSIPKGNYGVSELDIDHMGSFGLGNHESHFDIAFEATTSSQRYDADLSGLDAFVDSLWTFPADDTISKQLDATEVAHLQGQFQVSAANEPVPTQVQFESGEDFINDKSSIFSDSDGDEVDPAPVSCQAVEEPQILENASHALPNTQQSSCEEQVIENNDSDSLFGDDNKECQPESTEMTGQAVEEPLMSENNMIADAPPANPQVSEEQHDVQGYVDDDGSDSGDDSLGVVFEDVDLETALTSNQSADEPQSSTNTGSDMCDATDVISPEPIAQPDNGPEAQLNPGSEAQPTQEFGTQFDQELGAEPQAIEQPAPENQAATDAAPIEQVALGPQESQVTSDQSEATGGEGTEAPFTSQEVVPQEVVQQEPCNPLPSLPNWHEVRGYFGNRDAIREYARGQIRLYAPGTAVEMCSDLQLELLGTGTPEFRDMELWKYERCARTNQHYIVEFAEEYPEIPPHLVFTPIDNGQFIFHCLIARAPVQNASHNESAGIIDLTGDVSISSATATPSGVQEATLAAPAEIVAGAPVFATAGGDSVANGSGLLEEEAEVNRRVPKIPTPPPIDEATFAQGPVSLTNNAEPTTPVQNVADGNNGTWSSDWSGQAFSDGGESPRSPSNQEIHVMHHSVASDKHERETSPTDQAKGSKKARGKAPTGATTGSLSSVHGAHNALNQQLFPNGQAAGNVHAPPPAAAGTVAGPSNAAQPVQQGPAPQGATGKRHVGRPHKADSELTSPRKRQLKNPDSPCAEPSEGGNKRRRKNAPAAADTTDVSQGQQHGTSEESQPAQYYGPSPERSLDAKTWVEEHTQGGKGKKRKVPAPKKSPAPRKARKTKEATPAAPRTYRPIAPAPSRNQDDANGVQMQPRVSTPMGHSGAAGPSRNVQMNGNGTQMHSAAPPMQNGRSQQMRQQIPQQQGLQHPVGQQNGFTNHEQQQQHSEAPGPDVVKEKKAWLIAQLRELEQEDSNLAQQERQQGQQYPDVSSQMMSDPFTQQDFQEPQQQGFQQVPQQASQQAPHQPTQQRTQQRTQQPMQQPMQQMMPQIMPQTIEQQIQQQVRQQFRQLMQQQFQQPMQQPPMQQMMQQMMRQQIELQVRREFQQMLTPQVSQPPMAMPQTMFNQGMLSNGIASYTTNMQESHQQASPAVGYPAAGAFPQNGYLAPMDFNQGIEGTNVQGMFGGFDGGLGGAYMAQEGMPDFSG